MSDINKGGVGSGVKGHRTEKHFKTKSLDGMSNEDFSNYLEDRLWEWDNEGVIHEDEEPTEDYNAHLDEDGDIIGISSVYKNEINLLEINKSMRGEGHGTKLMFDIISNMIKEGYDNFNLESADENSNKFYRKLGLKETIKTVGGKEAHFFNADSKWMEDFTNSINSKNITKGFNIKSFLDSKKYDPLVGKKKDVKKMLDVGNWEYTLKIEKIKGNGDGRRIIAGWASDEFVDGDGEIMDLASLKAVEKGYMMNPVIRFMHNQSDLFRGAIGKVIPSYTDSGGVVHKTTFDKRPYLVIEISKSKAVDEIWKMIDEGLYTGLSIGGKASKKVKEWSSKLGKTVNRIFMRSWHETSVVDTPAASTGFFSVIKSQCSGLECACPLTTHNTPILYSERVNKFLQSDMGYVEKGGVGSGVKGHRTEREKKLDEALKEHKKFKAKVKDKDADIAYEKLFGDSGYIVKINTELDRRIAATTRFGTSEEKKKRESALRHKLASDFPFNMLKGKREKKEFKKYRDIYKLHLVDTKNELDIQLKVWDAFESTLKKEDIKKIHKALDEILGAEDVTKKKVWIKDRSKAPKGAKIIEGKKGGLYFETGEGGDGKQEASPKDKKVKEDDVKGKKKEGGKVDVAKLKEEALNSNKLAMDLDFHLSSANEQWYDGNMGMLDYIVTSTMGLDKGGSREQEKEYNVSDGTKTTIKEMYERNQVYLKEKYGDTITLYRGVDGKSYDKFKKLGEGAEADLETFNISSWTTEEGSAKSFASLMKKGAVIKVEVPTESILFHHDTAAIPEHWSGDGDDEKEVIIGGNNFKGTIESLHSKGET